MAKTRWTGKAAAVSVETTAFTTPPTWQQVGLTRTIAPPPLERSIIDLTAMEDTYSVGGVGIEQISVLTFQSIHDPSETVDTAIQTMYGTGQTRQWRVRATNGTLYWTQKFSGIVTAVRPQSLTGSDGRMFEVQVHRKSAVTHVVSTSTGDGI